MTPTELVTSRSDRKSELCDARGRRIQLRELTALDTLRLLKLAGPQLSMNQGWLSIATLAYSVSEIDGVPVPIPTSEVQIEAIVERLGDQTLTMIADSLDAPKGDVVPTEDHVGN